MTYPGSYSEAEHDRALGRLAADIGRCRVCKEDYDADGDCSCDRDDRWDIDEHQLHDEELQLRDECEEEADDG